jgi:hypothetical protein
MIHAFMTTLVKDMSTLEDIVSLNYTTLEQLNYIRIESLYDQLEVWTKYLREKNP